MFSRTLAHGNSNVEIRQQQKTEEDGKQKIVKMESKIECQKISPDGTYYSGLAPMQWCSIQFVRVSEHAVVQRTVPPGS